MDERDPDAVVDLTLPSDPRYLALVRVVVGAAAEVVPSLSEARVADLKLVATELFANAMEANWRSARRRGAAARSDATVAAGDVDPVRVRCRVGADDVELTVIDRGPGLEDTSDPHPPVEDPRRLDHERGLGIPLIQYLADRVDYETGPEGTSATVVLAERNPDRSRD